jgi:hypothetical protein
MKQILIRTKYWNFKILHFVVSEVRIFEDTMDLE